MRFTRLTYWVIVSIFTIDIAKRSGHEAFGRYTSAVQYLLHKSLILVPIFIAQKMVKTSENEGSGVSSLRKKRLELGCWGSNLACPSFGVVSLATNSRHSSQSFASDVRRSRSSVATYTLLQWKDLEGDARWRGGNPTIAKQSKANESKAEQRRAKQSTQWLAMKAYFNSYFQHSDCYNQGLPLLLYTCIRKWE